MASPTETHLAPEQLAGADPGVSWASIFAGAAGAIVISMLLVLLGLGLGFTATSPWMEQGASAEGLGVSGVVWLIATQIIASALGGYLAARLRRRQSGYHDSETRFRDIAHGFMAWAVATLLATILIAGSAANLLGAVASGAMSSAGPMISNLGGQDASYFVDSLLHSERAPLASDEPPQAVVMRIFTRTMSNDGQLAPEDRRYLVQLVSQRSEISQADAERRIDEVRAQAVKALEETKNTALQTADSAARMAARGALWTFLTLLSGAIFASLAAIYAGRRRDASPFADRPGYIPPSAV